MSNVFPLPPKMAAKFADRARAGEGKNLGHGVYVFEQGSEEITLMSLEPPMGHFTKIKKKATP